MRTDPSLMNTPTTLMNRIETPDSALSSSSLEALSSSLRTSLASRAQNKKGAKLYSSMKVSNITRETVLARGEAYGSHLEREDNGDDAGRRSPGCGV